MGDAESILKSRLQQAEQALERCEKMALATRYAGAIMHEVNNPLEAITNLVYLTTQQKHEPECVAEYMQVIRQQLDILARVTRQALTFHRQEKLAHDWDLIEIAEAALKLHAEKISRHRIAVERRYSGPAVTKMFGTEMMQVVSNLILNALDAAPHETGRLIVKAAVRRDSVHLIVADNGSGIAPKLREELFKPYTTSKETGTGIGLWLSDKIIRKHSGSLRFRSSTRKGHSGTTFRITLPVHTAN